MHSYSSQTETLQELVIWKEGYVSVSFRFQEPRVRQILFSAYILVWDGTQNNVHPTMGAISRVAFALEH